MCNGDGENNAEVACASCSDANKSEAVVANAAAEMSLEEGMVVGWMDYGGNSWICGGSLDLVGCWMVVSCHSSIDHQSSIPQNTSSYLLVYKNIILEQRNIIHGNCIFQK